MDVIINADRDLTPNGSKPLISQGNVYSNLLHCLGYPDNILPVAELLRQYYGLSGQWLVVSPMYWEATHNNAMIVACDQQLQLSERESRLWFAAFEEFVAHDQMTMYFHDPYTWLLQVTDKPLLTAKPVHNIVQSSLLPQLQALDSSNYWQRFITETQMFLSAHPLNTNREPCPINGVWLWGNGSLQPATSSTILSEEPLLSIAKSLSSQVRQYQAGDGISANSILLLPSLAPQALEDVQAKLQKQTVRWYWNNIAYTSQRLGWFSRLWRI